MWSAILTVNGTHSPQGAENRGFNHIKHFLSRNIFCLSLKEKVLIFKTIELFITSS